MSSILNSISSGDLLVLEAPRETPIKKDSIIELLQNSEIEFEILPKEDLPKLESPTYDIETEFDIKENVCPNNPEPPLESIDLENILQNSILDCSHSESVENFNTGFGENHDIHIQNPCPKPTYKTPLYYENYLTEFESEEDKAAARHALGLYNKGDVVAMSLLTAEDGIPSKLDLVLAPVKQLQKGATFFTPITTVYAVYDSLGVTLDVTLNTLQLSVVEHQKQLNLILLVSTSREISSLGDVKVFLQGFNNGDNLYKTLDEMNQEMVRFEKTGLITE